jgi:simple sugar transport system substrate-binding protein
VNDDRFVEHHVVPGSASRARRAVLRPLGVAALAAALAPRAAAQPKGPVAAPLKVAFVYVSPVSGVGWTPQHDAGRRELEQSLGQRVSTSFVENVAEGPDAERVIRDLASRGHRLIFATSFGYMEPTLRAARDFPEVAFEHLSGWQTAPNLAVYNARFYEGRWLAGMVAGHASRSNAIGYVAGFPIPEVLQGLNAFALGARTTNPKAEVRVVWTSAWFDPGRERDAAMALVNQGVDVLSMHTGSAAVPQAAEVRGVRVVGYHSDMSSVAPKAHLVSVTHHWGRYYARRARAVLEGSWRSGSTWSGIADGMVRVGPIASDVPSEVVDRLRAREADLVAGRAHPFTGPIRDNEGRVRLQRGAMGDDELNRIDWLVEGVVGRIPGAGR